MAEAVLDPALLARLDAVEPREELVLRLALRETHDALRSDQAFRDRVKVLINLLDPRPQEMAAILAEAREAESGIEERLAGGPPSRAKRTRRPRR